MPLEYKLSISLFLIGVTNIFLRGNRNWIFGYRSPMAIRTHKNYAYANGIYGTGMTLISVVYLFVLFWFPRLYATLSITEHLIVVVSYFALLFIIIEIKLRQFFKDQ